MDWTKTKTNAMFPGQTLAALLLPGGYPFHGVFSACKTASFMRPKCSRPQPTKLLHEISIRDRRPKEAKPRGSTFQR
jgi:hypothetical protein